jgi:hypothetical protein
MEHSKPVWVVGIVAALLLGAFLLWPRPSRAPIPAVVSPSTPQPAPYARVRGVEGTAFVKRGEVLYRAVSGLGLQPSDRVLTGPTSTVDVLWPGYGHTVVGNASVFEMARLEGTTSTLVANLRLFGGRVWSRIQRVIGTNDVFAVQASDVGSLVRGTSFGVQMLPNLVSIRVTESKVAAVHLLDGFVPDGAETSIAAGQVLEVPRVAGKPSVLGKPRAMTSAELADPFVKVASQEVPADELNRLMDPEKTDMPAVGKITAIEFQGRLIPMEVVHVGKPETGCDGEHYHANNGVAMAVDGTPVVDPGGCGFGKTKDVRAVEFVVR